MMTPQLFSTNRPTLPNEEPQPSTQKCAAPRMSSARGPRLDIEPGYRIKRDDGLLPRAAKRQCLAVRGDERAFDSPARHVRTEGVAKVGMIVGGPRLWNES